MARLDPADSVEVVSGRLLDAFRELDGPDSLVGFVLWEADVPVEMSPLSGARLVQLIQDNPEGAGAAIGFIAGGGPVGGPLLLLTVPAGIVAVSVSVSAAQWVSRKLARHG